MCLILSQTLFSVIITNKRKKFTITLFDVTNNEQKKDNLIIFKGKKNIFIHCLRNLFS